MKRLIVVLPMAALAGCMVHVGANPDHLAVYASPEQAQAAQAGHAIAAPVAVLGPVELSTVSSAAACTEEYVRIRTPAGIDGWVSVAALPAGMCDKHGAPADAATLESRRHDQL